MRRLDNGGRFESSRLVIRLVVADRAPVGKRAARTAVVETLEGFDPAIMSCNSD